MESLMEKRRSDDRLSPEIAREFKGEKTIKTVLKRGIVSSFSPNR